MSDSPSSSCDLQMPTSQTTTFGRCIGHRIAKRLSLAPRHPHKSARYERIASLAIPVTSMSEQPKKAYLILPSSKDNSVLNFGCGVSNRDLQHAGRQLRTPFGPSMRYRVLRPSGRASTCSQMSNSTACGSDMILSGRSMSKLAPSGGDHDTPLPTNRFGLLESRQSLQSSEGSKATLAEGLTSLLDLESVGSLNRPAARRLRIAPSLGSSPAYLNQSNFRFVKAKQTEHTVLKGL